METKPFTNVDDLVKLLDFLRANGVRAWVHGGWAIDALCGLNRPHKDIDLMGLLEDRPKLEKALGPMIVREFPCKLKINFHGCSVDMLLCYRDRRRRLASKTPRYLILLSDDALGDRTGSIAGHVVPVVSPLTVYAELMHTVRKTPEAIKKHLGEAERIKPFLSEDQIRTAPKRFPMENTRWNRIKFLLGIHG